MESHDADAPTSLPAPHFLPSVVDTAGGGPARRAAVTYLAPNAPRAVHDDGSLAAHDQNRIAAASVAAAVGGLQRGVKALLHFHDGSVTVLQPGTTRFNVGSLSIPAFSRLKPPDCRKMIEKHHLGFSYHDGVAAVSSEASSCGQPWGPFILRSSTTMPLLRNQPVALLDADAVFLASFHGRGIGAIQISFSTDPDAAIIGGDGGAHLPALQRALRACESERDRLRREVASLTACLADSDRLIYPSLARTTDALERRRVREDGIFCGCCGMLRLPDFFFPSILGAGVPPGSRRCAFCIRHIRQEHDLYGPPFTVPAGFTMPSLHPDDVARLADLIRCISCARMRHRSMFHAATVHLGMPRGATAYVEVIDAPYVITSPVQRRAPRCHATRTICVFCRRDLAVQKAAAAQNGAAASSSSHAAVPLPSDPADARSSTQWSPDPDGPGAAGTPDDYSSDEIDPPDDPFDLGDLGGALG